MTNSQPRNLVKIVNEDHKHCLMSGIRELWNSNCYYDATMVGRYQHGFSSVSVNKSVLAAVSHKFACLLTNAEDDVNIIFPDTDIQILKSFANFVYSGQIILNAECSNLAFELQSFFSEWDIQCSQTTCDKCYTSTSECEGVSKSKNLSCSKPQHSPLGYKQTVSQETIDQATDLNKFSHRTYTRKKKLYKPLVRLEVIPELSMATREPIDLAIDLATISNIVETKTITYDFSNGTSMEVHEEATETLLDEINCNFVNAENLKEEEKRNKELLSLLGTLTEKTTRYRLYVKHILGSDKKSTPAEVPKRK